mmetsp:Transcript_27228/g.88963  ORF Transcript_27228/g.88963 Transcript_27228/m.88963 type:complete len:90 (-) Transcript_27228:100-369(-)
MDLSIQSLQMLYKYVRYIHKLHGLHHLQCKNVRIFLESMVQEDHQEWKLVSVTVVISSNQSAIILILEQFFEITDKKSFERCGKKKASR